MSEEIDNKHIVFAHGLRLSDIDRSHFTLGDGYRVITLHIPGKNIEEFLVKIILNQINDKMDKIDDLFTISCPIGRNETRKILENNFIKDYFTSQFKMNLNKANDELEQLLQEIDPSITYEKINNITKFKKYLETLNYEEIKRNLNFEIRTYRSGDQMPRLLLQFRFVKKLSLIPGGIYKKDSFNDFDFDTESLLSEFKSAEDKIKSLVDFDLEKKYVFDSNDIKEVKDGVSFFETIKSKIPSGLLVVLSCGKYDGKSTREQRSKSTQRQRETRYRKYYVNYE